MGNYSFDIHERIKYLRERVLNINQSEMSAKLGIRQGSLSDIERKRTKKVTDRIIKDICREFSVNEEWLRFGKGEMFIENDSTIISKLSTEYNLDSLDKKIIESYLKLGEEQRKVIKDYVYSLAKAINSDEEIAATKENVLEKKQNMSQNEEDSIEKELNAYRLELEAEKKGKTSLVLDERKESLG
ncbi:helix-turn-helix domain-containing protein [Tepidibacter thalassicus]|uniref:Helix-turn-helix domain-containing protein n=1 Tax=Tepidibacter thalassicus DSM 15285 TaxID=1123350 RepID=A0A1M5NJ88_9FIRM|nr:helix-turn-helix transcriptional regulator [Tepidibacter thalassicus]SHG89581.1 Helix-turn-helix domain-containing protein [Tepidibacter thalassicus DSM 15285]